MTHTRLRELCLALPHVAETMQWGETLVLWAAPREQGGKMFTLLSLDTMPGDPKRPLVSFAAGPLRAPELLEIDGIVPAPYLARAHWVAATRWDALSPREWQAELSAAHTYVFDRLPARVRTRITGA